MLKKLLSVLSVSVFLTFAAHAEESCLKPGRNTALCFKMKTLRSQVNLLDAQRELMQVNFPYLSSVGSDIDQLAQKILTTSNPNAHLEALALVQQAASDLTGFADDRSIHAVQVANALKSNCLQCHGGEQPTSGIKWGDLSKQNWEQISLRCNTFGRNPWTCRQMHALNSGLTYFEASNLAGLRSFEAASAQLLEMSRITRELSQFEAVHGGNIPMKELGEKLTALHTLAVERKSEVFSQVLQLAESCQRCHQRYYRKKNREPYY